MGVMIDDVCCWCFGFCRWEVVGSSDDVEYSPFPVPRHGLLARVRRDDGVCAGRKGCPTDEDDNYDDDEVIV